jgi:hypothetical protein
MGWLTGRLPASVKRRVPVVRERDALRARVRELEARLDHERLFPVEWANRRVRDQFGDVVQAGPFRGMRYPDWAMTQVDAYSPKVLGSFERELHDAVEGVIAAVPRTVVNIGAAEGYYAVGMALRLPTARVVAFEPRPSQAEQLQVIAAFNETRIECVVAPCTHELLEGVLDAGAVVLCDCDGCEDPLLDTGAVPALNLCDVIVETHDLWDPGTTERLEARFGPTHDIERIETTPRFVRNFPQTGFMPLVTQQLAITEFREGPQSWLVMHSRSGPG